MRCQALFPLRGKSRQRAGGRTQGGREQKALSATCYLLPATCPLPPASCHLSVTPRRLVGVGWRVAIDLLRHLVEQLRGPRSPAVRGAALEHDLAGPLRV